MYKQHIWETMAKFFFTIASAGLSAFVTTQKGILIWKSRQILQKFSNLDWKKIKLEVVLWIIQHNWPDIESRRGSDDRYGEQVVRCARCQIPTVLGCMARMPCSSRWLATIVRQLENQIAFGANLVRLIWEHV